MEPVAHQVTGTIRERAFRRSAQARRNGAHPIRQSWTAQASVVSTVRLGLRENFWQFSLLVVVNEFVGAMVGMERSILPAVAEHGFRLAAHAAVLSFIVVF